MMTITRAPILRRLGRRCGPAVRRWVLLAGAPAVIGASCQVAGTAVIAPYRSPSMPQVAARALSGTTGMLDLSPDGTVVAVVDAHRGVCFHTAGTRSSAGFGTAPVCTDLRLSGPAPLSAAFSADGRWVALGQDVTARGRGLVWLVDPRTGAAKPVPTADGRSPVLSPVPPTTPSGAAPTGASASTGSPVVSSGRSTGQSTGPSTRSAPKQGVSFYTGLVWGAAGDLLLINSSQDADGLRTRLVDVDPESLVARVVAQATGPYEFQSGYLVTGGSTVLFTVYRGDQVLPNLVVIDLVSGRRREVGPIGPTGTQLVPLAVSPDGRLAVVGSATLTHPGPPRLLAVASGALTDIPGLTGDFGVAAFSPDGVRVAAVSTDANGQLSLTLAAVGGTPSPAARRLGAVAGPLPGSARLSWSRFDVLSLARSSTGTASINGWALTG